MCKSDEDICFEGSLNYLLGGDWKFIYIQW